MDAVVALLPVAPPLYPEDQVTDRNERFMAAEVVREKLMLALHDELPYGIAVEIERFEETPDGRVEIDAIIWVEREGQRKIVIGSKGEGLKAIGRAARLELNELLGRRVHLSTWVKLREDWTDDAGMLRRLGHDPRMSAPRRVLLEPAYLLHHRPWSDTSRILELMTRSHGRVTLFARGARRPGSALRGVLQPFVPLLVSWSGRADGGTLTGAEIGGALRPLPPAQLMSGFYLNELLLRLLPREDRHDRVFDCLRGCDRPSWPVPTTTRPLRVFELILLEELGYGLELARDAASGEPLEPDRYYHFQPGRGVLAVRDAAGEPDAIRGRDMLAVSCGEFDEPAALAAAQADTARRDRPLPRGSRPAQPRSDAGVAPAGAGSVSPTAIDLGVNIDHVATLRQARGGRSPGSAAGGADGRTIGRRQHHAAPARGSPPHPGPRRPGNARRTADAHEPGDCSDRGDARHRSAASCRPTSAWCRSGAAN